MPNGQKVKGLQKSASFTNVIANRLQKLKLPGAD